MRPYLKFLILAVLYYLTGRLGLRTAIEPGLATAIWPPSGIALAGLLVWGESFWPAVLTGSFLLNFGILRAANASLPLSLFLSLAIAFGSSLQVFLCNRGIRRFSPEGYPFENPREVSRFLFVGCASCVVAPTCGALAMRFSSLIDWSAFPGTWGTWWLGDLVGVLVVTPSLLVFWRERAFRRAGWSWEMVTLAGVTFGLLVYLLSGPLADKPARYPYLLVPCLLWATFRFEKRGCVSFVLLVATVLIWGTVRGFGPFAETELRKGLASLQIFIGMLSMMGLAVAALLAERQRQEQALRRSNQDLERFAHVASHDLREPLRTVSSYLSLLSRKYRGRLGDDADQYIAFVQEGARRMDRLIEGLLDYSRASATRRQNEDVDCVEIVKEVESSLEVAIAEAGARISLNGLGKVRADASQLSQLFQNLIGNALKFRSERPLEIVISCENTDEGKSISVRDNGIGFDMQYAAKVFQIFERLHSASKFQGSGIGLAICQRIVENHGGRIWVESEPGKGTAFFFTLPST